VKLSARQEASQLASIDDRIMPLINIVFLLLIFFLVAGVIREVEPVDVDPPRSMVEAESELAPLTIYVSADGRLALGDDVLSEDAFNAAVTQAVAADPEQAIRIVADRNVDSTKVITVLETLRSAGASRVKLTTQMQAAP
jgi:biopolymer transport protein ExbD